jgi:hypothetical protein
MKQFDDLTALPVPTTEIGVYESLEWKGFHALQIGVLSAQVAGIKPHSGNNTASFSVVNSPDGASLLVEYEGSRWESIVLRSFYFGCVIGYEKAAEVSQIRATIDKCCRELNSITSTPTDCTVTVRAFDAEYKIVAKKRFKFKANGPLQEMMFAPLGNKFLKPVKQFDIDIKSTSALPVGIISDDWKYTLSR